jgi:hypothetical protein
MVTGSSARAIGERLLDEVDEDCSGSIVGETLAEFDKGDRVRSPVNLASNATESVFFFFSGNFATLIIKSRSCSSHRSLVFFYWDEVQRLLGDVSLSYDHQVCRVDRITHDCRWLIQGSKTVVAMERKGKGEGFARGREKKANTRGGE